ncbi:MAG: hypothetical protein E6K78_00490 [Candidatus Eisenbacteria bacterium]|uniref:2-isopropylmalate synthase LeuA allosteric (dimerisation) domain-containing protein n=1 Tax=Eiseniibacteriota bacterium TaxID=2212470 RepID=A0A538TYB3_UNCEI|nr:MAG: hypothetical protein E6K78_00490 [Candidatus Eisenbacteria bacterium]
MNRHGVEGIALAVEPPGSWVARAEAAIRALRDVEGASILVAGDEVREIHILARSHRAPKQIVRDVQTVLLTRFRRSIDYRVVSVAYVGDDTTPTAVAAERVAPAAERPAPVPEREVVRAPALERPAPERSASAPERRPRERIRFASANLFVSAGRVQAQVELRWKGMTRMGSASGWCTRSAAHALVADAARLAVQEFMADELALGLKEVEFLRLGRRRVVVVSLSLLADRQEKLLVGSCVVDQDVPQAVALATLSALNRVVGGLRSKQASEQV